jgi:nucleoid-associated protein EbfC
MWTRRLRKSLNQDNFNSGILMGNFNLQEMMSQAKRQYETLQKKMQETVVESSSGGGAVTIKMDGRKQVLGVKLDPEAVKSGDIEMLQDLIAAAVNGAGRKVDDTVQSAMGGMLGGMGIPGIG